ncbi:MAG TPA: hypothetical protein VL974_14850 [Magnetospirillum sp.]|jgi:hypothetical protein|nr:hypothetical protein [Magnetospirillum sp.]
MASKTSLRIVSAETQSSQPKQATEQAAAPAPETAEDLRRRRAGIACFL